MQPIYQSLKPARVGSLNARHINRILQGVCIQIILSICCKLPALSQSPLSIAPLQQKITNQNVDSESINVEFASNSVNTLKSKLKSRVSPSLKKTPSLDIQRKDINSLNAAKSKLILSQVSLPSASLQQAGLNPSIQPGGIDPLQVMPDSRLDSSPSQNISESQSPSPSQYLSPSTVSPPVTPNPNIQPGGVDPLQTAPDSQVDKLKPTPQNTGGNAKLTDGLVQNALINTAGRYPWILNPTDKFTFSALQFRPGDQQVYSSFDFQTTDRSPGGSPGVNYFRLGVFPKKNSFYWILDDNQVLLETKGSLSGVEYQGESTDTTLTQTMNLSQSYGGYQFVTALAPDMERLLGNSNSNQGNAANGVSILSVAAQITNLVGIPAPPITINNPAIVGNSGNITNVQIPSQSTFFGNTAVANAPTVLQAYPTVNLQALAGLGFYTGETVPVDTLQQAGIKFGSVFQNIAPTFTPTVSSTAGIKILQVGKFDNPDLLDMLLDRSLTENSKTVHYLNSLYWTSYGINIDSQTQPVINTNTYKWYRLYASEAHNRALIQYDKEKPFATFTQVFSNPGISLTFRSDNNFSVDVAQSIASTLGFAPGFIFEQLNPQKLNNLLKIARKRYENHQIFSPLKTKTTSEQRRKINSRLNSTLAYANLTSGVQQLSGQFTFSGIIKPDESSMWQVRTGLYRRSVSFSEVQSTVTSGPITFGDVRLSPDNLGPLGFANSFVPQNQVANSNPSNQSYAVQTLVTNASGKQFLFQDSSSNLLGVPIPTRSTALVFDRFQLLRSETLNAKNYSFFGYQFLPAVETVFSGTKGNLNYSASVGTWANPNPNQLLNVADNQSNFKEPEAGLYTNVSVNSTNLKVTRDAKGNPLEIFNFSPSLTLRWNSASSTLNQNQIALSSLFFYQSKKLEFAVAPGFQYGDQSFVLLPARVRFSSGLSFEGGLEIGTLTYCHLDALQPLRKDLSLGLYARNFTDINGNRYSGYSYGVKVRYNLPKTVLFTDFTIGTSNYGLDVRMQGSLSF